MNLLENKKTTYVIPTCYQLTTIFRDGPKIKAYTRDKRYIGISYSELIKLEEYERKVRR